ncbi:MAG: ankyrin repeat domain-containing protein [Cyanobacteria bacterium P01_D01_bin.123]
MLYSFNFRSRHPLRYQVWTAYLTARSLLQHELAEACLSRWYDLTSACIARCASPERKRQAERLKQAISAGDLDAAISLPEPARWVDWAIDSNRNTPLHLSVACNRIDITRWLLVQGARTNIRNLTHYTPLHEATLRGSLEPLRLLIEAGANVNARTLDGETPLSLACAGAIAIDRCGRVAHRPARQAIELLIEQGARVNVRCRNGLTPLHEATYPEQPEAMELLIACGADVNARDVALQTPLHHAVAGAAIEATRLLVAGGADLYARDVAGLTPLERARQLESSPVERDRQHYRILHQILKLHAPVETED